MDQTRSARNLVEVICEKPRLLPNFTRITRYMMLIRGVLGNRRTLETAIAWVTRLCASWFQREYVHHVPPNFQLTQVAHEFLPPALAAPSALSMITYASIKDAPLRRPRIFHTVISRDLLTLRVCTTTTAPFSANILQIRYDGEFPATKGQPILSARRTPKRLSIFVTKMYTRTSKRDSRVIAIGRLPPMPPHTPRMPDAEDLHVENSRLASDQ